MIRKRTRMLQEKDEMEMETKEEEGVQTMCIIDDPLKKGIEDGAGSSLPLEP